MSLQRCEGSNLESVLEEVRTRFGDTVTIVEANRLRKGGIGGFFARERFEVVVDIDDESGDAEADAFAAGPTGTATELPAEYGLAATEDFCDRLLTMADGVSDLEGATAGAGLPATPAGSPISTEQPQFSAVLDSITRHMDAGPARLSPPPAGPTPSSGSASSAGPMPAVGSVDVSLPPAGPTPSSGSADVSLPPAGPMPAAGPTSLAGFPSLAGTSSAGPASLAGSALPGPATPGVAVEARALARLGLPEDIRRAAFGSPAPAGGDPSAWLLGLLQDLPAADRLPQGPGSVIVVAGGREAALHLARQVAGELGLDSDGLLVASPTYKGRAVPVERRITAVEAAAAARSSWRRRPRPTVVAVDAPMGRTPEWARRVIDALEPTMVWGAVDATRKPEDVFEWAERLGGFDALGVTGVESTVSPAAVLQCGIPVGRLEGRPATPLLWASLLAPRLAA